MTLILESIFIGLFSFVALYFAFKSPNKIYTWLSGISILTSSLIFDQKVPVVDEIIYVVLSIFCVIQLIRKPLWSIRELRKTSKVEISILVYLILNCVISFYFHHANSSLRFAVLFSTFLIFMIYIKSSQQNLESLSRNSIRFFSLYLYCWVAYWIVLAAIGIDWGSQQSKSLAGSSYAAIVPFVGLSALSYAYCFYKTNLINKLFWINFVTTIVASQLFDSRALYLSIFILSGYLLISKFSIKMATKLILSFVMALIVSNLLGTLAPPQSTNTYKSSSVQLENLKDSINFVDQPRVSDEDRSHQIRCATKLITRESRFVNLLFGFGQNNHKTELLRCYGLDPSTPGSGVRPVGYAAFIVDFGIVGVLGILVLYIKRMKQLLFREKSVLLSITLTLLIFWSLITNYLDHSLLLLVLFLDYFSFFRQSLQQVGSKSLRGPGD